MAGADLTNRSTPAACITLGPHAWVVMAIALAASPVWAAGVSCEGDLSALHAAETVPLTASGSSKFSLAARHCTRVGTADDEPVRREAEQLSLYGSDASTTPAPGASAPLVHRDSGAARIAPARPVPIARGQAQRVLAVAPALTRAALQYDIDPLLLHAVAHVESRHNPLAQSPAGARGLMQVMPKTAQRFGVHLPGQELLDVETNARVSAEYLKTLQKRFGNNLPLVLAAYNAGEGAVEKHGRRVPPYRETQAYVRMVIDTYLKLRAAAARAVVRGATANGSVTP